MNKEYLGRWRIVDMEEWDQDYIDMEVPGYNKLPMGRDRRRRMP